MGISRMLLTQETEMLVINLSQCHFLQTNLTWSDLELNTDPRIERPATNGLMHGTVFVILWVPISSLEGQKKTATSYADCG